MGRGPTGDRLALEQDHLEAGLCEIVGRGASDDPGPNHHDVRGQRHGVSFPFGQMIGPLGRRSTNMLISSADRGPGIISTLVVARELTLAVIG